VTTDPTDDVFTADEHAEIKAALEAAAARARADGGVFIIDEAQTMLPGGRRRLLTELGLGHLAARIPDHPDPAGDSLRESLELGRSAVSPNALILGRSGGYKVTAMLGEVAAARARGEHIVVFDPKTGTQTVL
jgi:hypothetical protein